MKRFQIVLLLVFVLGISSCSVPPLYMAVYKKNTKKIDALIKEGKSIDERWYGFTLLQYAVGYDDLDIVKHIVSHGADRDVNTLGWFGVGPLHIAVAENRIDVIKYLISIGADVNLKGKDGMTPLQLAVQPRRWRFFSVNPEKSSYGASYTEMTERTANMEMIRMLVSAGARFDFLKDNPMILFDAAGNGDLALVQFLVENGAELNHNIEYEYQTSEGKRRLNKLGGYNILHYTTYRLVNLKRELREEQEAKGKDEESYDNFALVAVLDYFISNKLVDLQSVDGKGRTLLYYPMEYYMTDVVIYLLSQGVDPDRGDFNGEDAFDWLRRFRKHNIYYLAQPEFVKIGMALKRYSKVQKPAPKPHSPRTKASPQGLAGAASMDSSDSLTDRMVDKAGDCVKMSLALKLCEQMPWPMSVGCEKMTRAKFDNLMCDHLKF